MAIRARNIRQMMKEHGRNFNRHFRNLLGIREVSYPDGMFPVEVRDAQISPDEFSIRDLTEGMLGHEFVEGLHGKNWPSFLHDFYNVREAVNPITPSTQGDINAWSASLSQLIEVRILEGYQLAENIGRSWVKIVPTRVNSQRIIGEASVQLPQRPTLPGEEIPSIGQDPRWVIRPELIKYAQKMGLARETVLFDLTGEMLGRGESMGKTLSYAEDYYIGATVQGVNVPAGAGAGVPDQVNGITGQTYIYKGQPGDTPNATYQTVAGTGASLKYNYANKESRTLVDWKDVQEVRGQLSLRTDFEANLRIKAELKDALVSPFGYDNAKNIWRATQVVPVSGGGTTNFPTNYTMAPNPAELSMPNLKQSAIWEKVLVDSGISQANAQKYTTWGDFKKAFAWYEAWPLQLETALPTSSEMITTQTVHLWVASWYGVPVVCDARFVHQFTN